MGLHRVARLGLTSLGTIQPADTMVNHGVGHELSPPTSRRPGRSTRWGQRRGLCEPNSSPRISPTGELRARGTVLEPRGNELVLLKLLTLGSSQSFRSSRRVRRGCLPLRGLELLLAAFEIRLPLTGQFFRGHVLPMLLRLITGPTRPSETRYHEGARRFTVPHPGIGNG